jgi:ribosomal protein S18 acetylase RimI-like enzyme
MKTVTIRAATASDAEAVVDTLTLAFSADPAARWLYPDSRRYLERFPGFIKAFAGAAFEHGSAYCAVDHAGAALWLPPGVRPDEEALSALVKNTVGERRRADVLALLEQMDRCHPAEPHWYLPMIGVDPASQGKGCGSALLAHTLERCDREDALAYLESSSPKNIPLYIRHGFETLGTIQAGSSAPLFPMMRRPRHRSAAEKTDLRPTNAPRG